MKSIFGTMSPRRPTMKNIIGANILRYRKEQGLTQEELAKKLSITYQAVSKWETGQTTPDIALLPVLASILKVNIDKLLGYSHNFDLRSLYDQKYKSEDYYWGVKPSNMCFRVLELMPPDRPLKLLDICCGEGKDAVFMARCGYIVSAFDVSEAGVEKTKKLAEKANVEIDAFKADILDFRLEREYDILFSSGSFQYMKPELVDEIITNYKTFTADNEINAFNVHIEKPFIEIAPRRRINQYYWKSGQILSMYHDWYIEDFSEYIFDCNSSGIPHKHPMNKMYARKISDKKS